MKESKSIAAIGSNFKDLFGHNLAHKGSFEGLVPPATEAGALTGFAPLVAELAPEAEPRRVQAVAERLHAHFDEYLDTFEKYYAIAWALQAGRAAHSPNSVASLMPDLSSTGGIATPGQVYPLYTTLGGVVQVGQSFTFVREQTFHRIKTSKVDADAGWMFAGGTVKFQDDPIAGIFYDASFTAFEAEVPFDRTPLGAYERRTFRNDATINFTASAFINPNSAAAEMVSGLMLEYRDDRCQKIRVLEDLEPVDFAEIVGHIVGQRRAAHGVGASRRRAY